VGVAPVTVAVKVTAAPRLEGLAPPVNARVVAVAGRESTTDWESGAEALGALLVLPR
jgi:hypothetical protein